MSTTLNQVVQRLAAPDMEGFATYFEESDYVQFQKTGYDSTVNNGSGIHNQFGDSQRLKWASLLPRPQPY